MRDVRCLFTVLIAALSFASAAGCDDSGEDALSGDYTNCGSAVLDEQKAVCDDLLTGVVRSCGFGLTVDPCACTDEVEGCAEDTEWLSAIADCRDAAGCVAFIDCLEAVGVSPSGCSSPASWDCLIQSATGE